MLNTEISIRRTFALWQEFSAKSVEIYLKELNEMKEKLKAIGWDYQRSLYRSCFVWKGLEMDWKKVDEALRLVDRAIDSVEFGNWVERRRDDLDCDYDSYQIGCHKDLEEPDSFYVWALGRFLQRKLVKA